MPARSSSHSRFRFVRRYIWLGLALPCVYVGAASIAFVVRQRQASAALASTRLPVLPAPSATTRLMIFAPHCDDETLGCAGLIQQTLAAGGKAQAVILTNGDGFRTAVECQTHRLRVTAGDFIQFADLRQQESVRALGNLGIAAQDVRFLGYPDQGLQSLWNDNWTPDHLYTSRTTQCDHAPYANVFHKETPYCGQSVMDDIKANLRAFQPTLVTVTHPAEDHADHAATAAFVARALQELQADPLDAKWAAQTKLEYYLVHRGDWPLPASSGESGASSPLVPPLEMARADTRWMSRPLTPTQTRHKAQSIGLYPSQTAMMGRFLNAFARSTELYGEIAPARLPLVPDNAIRVDANTNDWESLPPCLLDPVRDNVLRDLQGSGDIRALYACHDSRYLYVRLDCRQPVSRRLRYTLHLRAFANDGQTTTKAAVVRLRPASPGTVTPEGIRLASQNRTLEAAIPWTLLTQNMQGARGEEKAQQAQEAAEKVVANQVVEEPVMKKQEGTENRKAVSSLLSIQTIAVSAETWAGVEIDKTGVRFLKVSGE